MKLFFVFKSAVTVFHVQSKLGAPCQLQHKSQSRSLWQSCASNTGVERLERSQSTQYNAAIQSNLLRLWDRKANREGCMGDGPCSFLARQSIADPIDIRVSDWLNRASNF